MPAERELERSLQRYEIFLGFARETAPKSDNGSVKLSSGAEAYLTAGFQFDGAGVELLEGLSDVSDLYGLVECGRYRPVVSRHTVGQRGNDAVADVLLHPACITEVTRALLQGQLNGGEQFLGSLVGEHVVLAFQQAAGNVHELLSVIVLKAELVRKAPHEPGIGLEHAVHFLLVPCQNDEHVRVGLCQHGEQRVDDPSSEVLAVCRPRQ